MPTPAVSHNEVEGHGLVTERGPGVMFRDHLFAVDFWRKRHIGDVRCFFLTHAHSDHMDGLTSTWAWPLYCTRVTGKLVKLLRKVPSQYIKVLSLNEPTEIVVPIVNSSYHAPSSNQSPGEGVRDYKLLVTAIDSSHCAGGAAFIFEAAFGRILCTGDFRYERLDDIPKLLRETRFDLVHCDGTYRALDHCATDTDQDDQSEKRKFLTECEVIDRFVDLVHEYDDYAVLVAVRNLGREHLLQRIAIKAEKELYMESGRLRVLSCMTDIRQVFTSEDPSTCALFALVAHNNYDLQRHVAQIKSWTGREVLCVLMSCDPLLKGYQWDEHAVESSVARVIGCSVQWLTYSNHCSPHELHQFLEAVPHELCVFHSEMPLKRRGGKTQLRKQSLDVNQGVSTSTACNDPQGTLINNNAGSKRPPETRSDHHNVSLLSPDDMPCSSHKKRVSFSAETRIRDGSARSETRTSQRNSTNKHKRRKVAIQFDDDDMNVQTSPDSNAIAESPVKCYEQLPVNLAVSSEESIGCDRNDHNVMFRRTMQCILRLDQEQHVNDSPKKRVTTVGSGVAFEDKTTKFDLETHRLICRALGI